jgi:two-component system, chemotaxis family, protein-glutamate methylesterase/glutaminase
MPSQPTPIRVLIVDDSLLIRTVLNTMLIDVPGIKVVGQAANGQEAVRMALRLKPHVITMDIRMPKMDGLEATSYIMSVCPTPIVVISSSVYASDYNIAFNAIAAGALTVIEKPHGLGSSDYEAVREQLVTAVRTMAGVPVVGRPKNPLIDSQIGPMTALLQAMINRPIRVIAIGASTGGPPVLFSILSNLPKDFSIPIMIVQHIMQSFVPSLVDWLNTKSSLPVKVAREGDQLAPSKVFLAPGNFHLTVHNQGVMHLDNSALIQGQRPSATRLFQSVAETYKADAVGILLTGMGEDGVDGLLAMSQAGAHVIAQDQASSSVFGMPKAAIDRGVVDEVLSPEQTVNRLIKLHNHIKSLQQGKT